MKHSKLLASLQKVSSTQDMAVIIADTVIAKLPEQLAVVARRCALLNWFTPEMIKALFNETSNQEMGSKIFRRSKASRFLDGRLLKKLLSSLFLRSKVQGINQQGIQTILELPFIEKKPQGYSFHTTTHEGFLEKYKQENPEEIRLTYRLVLPELLKNWDNDKTAQTVIYALAITGETTVFQARLDELLLRLGKNGSYQRIFQIFEILEKAEKLEISEPVKLTVSQYLFRSQWYLANGRINHSFSDIDNAMELEPDNLEVLQRRSFLHVTMGNSDLALTDAARLIKVRPDSESFLHRARIYKLQDEAKLALVDYNKAIKLNSKKGLLYLERGMIYDKLSRPQNALCDFSKATTLSPEDPQIYIARAFIYLSKNDYDNFEKDINTLLTLRKLTDDEKAQALLFRCMVYRNKGFFEKALLDVEQSITLSPNKHLAFLERGSIYLKLKEYTQALSSFDIALRISPNSSLIYEKILITHLSMGNIRLAGNIYDKIQAIDEYDHMSYLNLAREIALKFKLYDLTITICEKVLKEKPNDNIVLNMVYDILGYSNLFNGKLDKAHFFYRNSLKFSNKRSPYSMKNKRFDLGAISARIDTEIFLGIIEWRLGNIDSAKLVFSNSLTTLKLHFSRQNKKNIPKIIYPSIGWLEIMMESPKSGFSKLEHYMDEKNMSIRDNSMQLLFSATEALLESEIPPPKSMKEVKRLLEQFLVDEGK